MWPGVTPGHSWVVRLSVVAVFALRSRNRRIHGDQRPRHHPSLLAGGESWCQQPVIDLSGYRETIELRGWNKQPRIVRKAIRSGVDVAFGGGHHPVVVGIDPRHFGRVSIEEAGVKVVDLRLKRCQALVHVKEDFIREPAGNESLTELALRIVVGIEFVRIARTGCLYLTLVVR